MSTPVAHHTIPLGSRQRFRAGAESKTILSLILSH
jgi:hypothetical protein